MPVVYTGMHRGERFNSISHLIGAALALAGSVVLVSFAAMDGDSRKVVSYSVYGLTLFLLFLFSTLYHALDGPAKRAFRVLDHQAIYLLIAGTYTPFTLVALRGTLGWCMFGAMAVFGILLDALPRKGPRVVRIPDGPGQVDFCPGTGRGISLIRVEREQVTADEAAGQPQMPACLHEQGREIATTLCGRTLRMPCVTRRGSTSSASASGLTRKRHFSGCPRH